MASVFKFRFSDFRRARYWLPALLLAGILLSGLGLLVAPALLCVAVPTSKADVIIVLGGEDGSRLEGAVSLFKAHWANHVIMTGENDMYRQEMIRLGVPDTAIWMEPQANSTAQNAEFSIQIMRVHGCKSALIVTSWYHTRRARACFQHYGAGLAFYPQPTRPSAEVARNWGSQDPFILKEYPKLIWYWLRYGISPF